MHAGVKPTAIAGRTQADGQAGEEPVLPTGPARTQLPHRLSAALSPIRL